MESIVVGLSGGVDSSVAAASLHHKGYDVVGVTLWLMRGKGQCCSEGMVDAARICEQLGVPHHVVDSRDLFQSEIIDYLVQGYGVGVTPLPCSQCNRAVKFLPMLQYAREHLSIDRIATGHYARIRYDESCDRYQLLRAIDRNKDQSYFLYDLVQEVLAFTQFPLGEQTKEQTREIAAKFQLHTAEKPESQDLCLVESHGSMQSFLDKYLSPKPGEIVDRAGQVLGQHTGIHHYTIGQRKGLGVAAPHPLYVIGLDPARNQVIVGDRQSAYQPACVVRRVNWVSIPPASAPLRVMTQIRYRSPAVPATLIPSSSDDHIRLVFDEPQFSITPGQAAVWYDEQGNEVLLGGGVIEAVETSS